MAVDDLHDDVLDADDDTDRPSRPSISRSLDPDNLLDNLVPSSIDWRDTVRRHPVASVATVGLIGYLVGRSRGSTIMAGLSAGLSAAMMRQLADVFEGDFFDF